MRPTTHAALTTLLFIGTLVAGWVGAEYFGTPWLAVGAVVGLAILHFILEYRRGKTTKDKAELLDQLTQDLLDYARAEPQAAAGIVLRTKRKDPFRFRYVCSKMRQHPMRSREFASRPGTAVYDAYEQKMQKTAAEGQGWLVATPIPHPAQHHTIIAVLVVFTVDSTRRLAVEQTSNRLAPLISECLITREVVSS